MRPLVASCSFFLLIFMAEGCQHHSVSADCPHDARLRTYKQWRESVRFPYTAPGVRRERIVKSYERVAVGSTKEEFVAALGEPDFEEELYPKEPNRPCRGYAFTYYFEKPQDVVNDIRDKRIEAFFSPAGRATWIASNVSGLSEKGNSSAIRK